MAHTGIEARFQIDVQKCQNYGRLEVWQRVFEPSAHVLTAFRCTVPADVQLHFLEGAGPFAALVELRFSVEGISFWKTLERIENPKLAAHYAASQGQICRGTAFPRAAFNDVAA